MALVTFAVQSIQAVHLLTDLGGELFDQTGEFVFQLAFPLGTGFGQLL